MSFCCQRFADAVHQGHITVDAKDQFAIFGMPRFVHDGAGHYDDITEQLDIDFCPFCGYFRAVAEHGKANPLP